MATVAKIPESGRAIYANRLKGLGTEPNRIGWGRGNTPPADNDPGLENAAAESKVAGTSTIQTTTTNNDTYRVVGTLTSASEQTITEVGLFNAADNLFLRATFTGLPLDVGDAIQFTVEAQTEAPS